LALYPDALRADLQQYYGIDIDAAMAGRHSAAHVAALVAGLPRGARLWATVEPDSAWTLEATVTAYVANILLRVFGKEGHGWIGPRAIQPKQDEQTNIGVEMDAAELMDYLSRPRTAAAPQEAG
jgi:hypothetical protein